MTDPVCITFQNRGSSEDTLQCTLRLPGGDPKLDNVFNFNKMVLPGLVECRLELWGGRKKKPTLQLLAQCQALRTHFGAWIVRRAVAQSAFEGVCPRELSLTPTAVTIDGQIVDRDWVFLDVRALLPLDRDASKLEFELADNPHGSAPTPDTLREARWGERGTSSYSVFRCGDFPQLVFTSSSICAKLEALTGGRIAAASMPFGCDESLAANSGKEPINSSMTFSYIRGVFHADPAAAKDAANAFWALYAGGTDDSARDAVLQNPHYAFWLAMVIDREPRADSRSAACAHARYAVAYARYVDQAPSNETREAAAKDFGAALSYLAQVELADHPELQRAAMREGRRDAYEEALRSPIVHYAKKLREGRIDLNALPSTAYADYQAPHVRVASPPSALAEVPRSQRFAASASKGTLQTHAALSSEERIALSDSVERAASSRGVPSSASPGTLVHALQEWLRTPPNKVADDEARDAGVLWGEQLSRQLGWQWAIVTMSKGRPLVGLISPDAAYALDPVTAVREIVAGQRPCNLELLFNMLAAQQLPPSGPGKYVVVS